jgi:hypothetical protein
MNSCNDGFGYNFQSVITAKEKVMKLHREINKGYGKHEDKF